MTAHTAQEEGGVFKLTSLIHIQKDSFVCIFPGNISRPQTSYIYIASSITCRKLKAIHTGVGFGSGTKTIVVYKLTVPFYIAHVPCTTIPLSYCCLQVAVISTVYMFRAIPTQSENLRNLEIALRILRIPRLRSNLEIAHYTCAISRLRTILAQSRDCALHCAISRLRTTLRYLEIAQV